MKVMVETQCGRCPKKSTTEMTIEEAQELETKKEARAAIADSLTETLNSSLGVDGPDIIIAKRNENGSYVVKHLSDLCTLPDAVRNKGCASRVEQLVLDIMNEVKKPVKKKKKKTTDTVIAIGESSESGTKITTAKTKETKK